MKKAVQWTAVLALAVFVRNIHYFIGDRVWEELVTPFRAARVAARRRHEGQDIFAKRGTPVRSATDGLVIKVGDNKLGGHAVWVLGAGGRTYYYAHLDRWAAGLTRGQLIERGTLLGYVGNTGNARGTPPHLHFGVYGPGGAINPLPLLARGEVSEADFSVCGGLQPARFDAKNTAPAPPTRPSA